MSTPSGKNGSGYDHSFKIVLIGDSGVGKSSLLVSFVTGKVTDLPNTIGVDMKIKELTVGNKRLKLTIWDTAGQERYRTLTSTYYRDAHGIILVYDVTQKQTFTNLANLWTREVELYSTNKDCLKILIGNKVDRESERQVSTEEGMSLAKQHGFLFLESSAKTRENVEKCFEDLALKILENFERKEQEELKKREAASKQPEPKPVELKPKPGGDGGSGGCGDGGGGGSSGGGRSSGGDGKSSCS